MSQGKVRQLDDFHPQLATSDQPSSAAGTIETQVEHLDLATALKVAQAVSSEIVLDHLIDTIMRSAIAHAGGERGLLIVPTDAEPNIVAQASSSSDTLCVNLGKQSLRADMLPESVVHYTMRTKESVILGDACTRHDFSTDPYIKRGHARSIACMPLVNQGKLIALLYLENNFAPAVFTASRIAVLKLLASQAAISLENSRLYRDLAEREARIRRLVDANIIGVFIWDFDGRILEANDPFLQIIGYERADLASGRMRWTDLTPASARDRDARAMAEIKTLGCVPSYEKEFVRSDGSRVAVLVGAATYGDAQEQGVTFVVDLTGRKRAESEARESERRYHEIGMELAHANRVATMGQLTASIAHEITQPIAAAVTNAHAAMHWLNARTPDLEEVRQALVRIVRDGTRANNVIGRIRALVRKAPAHIERIVVNETIREVISLTRTEAAKHGVSVKTHLDDALPLVDGDRVQLQQVMLNLIINAIQAMTNVHDGPRELLITTRTNGLQAGSQAARVAVCDTGPGVGPRDSESLFEPFYTTKDDGMGMGLSISRSIVEAHGGTLEALANFPRGARFEFQLPGVGRDGWLENEENATKP